MDDAIFEKWRAVLTLQTLSTIWRGHGSAIFLEFGRLHPRVRRNGLPGNPNGDYTVAMEWSWRIEDERSILCGSWDDEKEWDGFFKSLVGRKIESISLFGRLPELSIALSGGFYVASFMTAAEQPAWAIIDHTHGQHTSRSISVMNGKVHESLRADQETGGGAPAA